MYFQMVIKDTGSQKWYMISGLVGDAESFYLGIKDGNGEKVTDNDIAKITSEKLIEVNKFAQKDSMGMQLQSILR